MSAVEAVTQVDDAPISANTFQQYAAIPLLHFCKIAAYRGY
jgi:hypothetical protein